MELFLRFGGDFARLRFQHAELVSPLRQFWGRFVSPEPSEELSLAIEQRQEPGGFSGQAEFRQFSNGRLYHMGAASKSITISFQTKPWQAYVQTFRDHPPLETYHLLVEPTLVLMLKRLGWFYAHCSCVELEGRGILLPGPSGSGKTTTATRLYLDGARHVCDDRLLIEHRPDGSLVGHRVEQQPHLSLCLDAPALFPEAAEAREYRKGHRDKKFLEVPEADSPGSARLELVLFPRVAPSEETRLEPMDPGEVMLRWMGQEPIEYHAMLADRRADAAQFAHYGHLAELPCYQLTLGRSLEGLTQMVRQLPRQPTCQPCA